MERVCSKKLAFMNSSYFVICEVNCTVSFMAIVKHFRVKMRLASLCCVNLISTVKITSRTYFLRRITFQNDVPVFCGHTVEHFVKKIQRVTRAT